MINSAKKAQRTPSYKKKLKITKYQGKLYCVSKFTPNLNLTYFDELVVRNTRTS